MGEADRQAPGPVVLSPREIVELLRGGEGDLVVVFHLVGDLGHARAGDRAPDCDTTSRSARPACGSPGSSRNRRGRCRWSAAPRSRAAGRADEMHLARQAGAIARAAQVMGDRSGCRRRTRPRCHRPGAEGRLPRHEARPPRRAERRGGVGVGEAGERSASALRFGACSQSAGPSGKSVPFSWSTIRIRMLGGRDQLFLGAEIMMRQRGRHAGAAGNVRHRDIHRTARADGFDGRIRQCLAANWFHADLGHLHTFREMDGRGRNLDGSPSLVLID
jgi:hypothetical protein